MHVHLYQYFQFAALAAAIVFYRDIKKEKLLPFFYLCLLAVLVESVSMMVIYLKFANNYFIINIYFLLSTPLFLIGYFKQLRLSAGNQKRYLLIATLIVFLFLINYLVGEGPTSMNTLAIICQQFINILLSCGLLFQLAIREEYISLSKEPMFWISAGLLIFSLGTLVVLGMNQFIRINSITIHNKNLYRVIMPALNVILYSLYTYAFYLCMRKRKSYSPSSL